MKSIEIENVGPIHRLTMEVKPGLNVLLGANGSGKSQSLEAARALVEGKGKLQANDDADEGHVRGFGADLRVGRTTTRSGELEVATLAGEDLATLVDPHIKNPESADVERIKALCRLAKVKPELQPFEELVGGAEELRAIATPKSLGLESLPEMAAAIKRDVEATARKVESEQENEAGRAAGLREGLSEEDLKAPSDQVVLAAVSDEALRRLAALEAEEKAAKLARTSGEAARKILDGSPKGRPVAECQAALQSAQNVLEGTRTAMEALRDPEALYLAQARRAVEEAQGGVDAAGRDVEAARRALQAAEGEVREAVLRRDAARNALESNRQAAIRSGEAEMLASKRGVDAAIEALAVAEREKTARAAAEEAVARAEGSADPTVIAAHAEKARGALEVARKAQEYGAVVRTLLVRAQEAEKAASRAKELGKEGERYRNIAAACEDVVTKAIRIVAPRGMFVKRGRLMIQTDRGETLFAELSKGQRTLVGLDIEIDALSAVEVDGDGVAKVLVIAQELHEGLDPQARRNVDAKLRERNVVGLTAQATDGELRATVFAEGQ